MNITLTVEGSAYNVKEIIFIDNEQINFESMKANFILLITGVIITIIGSLLKIYHSEYSNYVITLGLILELFAIFLLIKSYFLKANKT